MKLDKLLNPRSVAVIGASREPEKVGYGVLKNLVKGCYFLAPFCAPFKGKIYPVNPFAVNILGLKCYKSILEIDDEIDLAIIVVPANAVLQVVKECVKKKVGAVIIISAGFSEAGEKGKRLEAEVLKVLKKAGIPLLGPNCLGVIRPTKGLNASFAPTMPPAGKVAFITQSGALADSVIDWAVQERYGFSAIVSVGNAAMLDVSDFIEYFANDEETKAITVYLENVKDGRRFIECCKEAVKKKPVIVLKAGRSKIGEKAALSHTGRMVSSYDIYMAAFKQAGIEVVDSVEELFDVAKANAMLSKCENAIAIVTNGGGAGVLCADYCEEFGINLVELKKSTIKKLEKSKVMHPAFSKRNPLDIIGDALPERYEVAINTLLEEDYIKGLIVIQTLQTMTRSEDDARIIIEARKRFPKKPIVCCFMGTYFTRRAIHLLEANNVPNYSDPRRAARAMASLIKKS